MKKFLLFFLVNLLVHLPFLHLPPCGTHVWRQCNTLAMSRNFAEEGMNILEPKIDRRNETNGITGSHFPLYEWILAAFSKLFGFSDLLARLFSVMVFSLAMFAFYRLLVHFNFTETMAAWGALLLLSIPELYYHSINAMPDNLALFLSLAALVEWLKYQKEGRTKYLISAIVFSTLGGLIKFQFLMIPLATLVFVPFHFKKYLRYFLFWLCILLPVFAWYYYAIHLTQINNLKEFGLWIKPMDAIYILTTIQNNLTMDFPEVLTGWPLFIACFMLLFQLIPQIKASSYKWFIVAWLLMFIVFYFAAIERMKDHAYYFMPLLPLAALVFMLGARKQGLKNRFIYSIIVLNFIWAFARIIPSRWVESKRQIPVEFSDKSAREEFSKTIPANSKCVVGPDISGCIFFYFTHTKGYSFEHTSELVTMKNGRCDIDNMRMSGVKYLIIRNGNLLVPFMNEIHLKRKIRTIGEFDIWEL